jgi:tetratricopeptide (TPR) repeat protein
MTTATTKRNKPLSKKHASRAAEMLQRAGSFYQAGNLQEAEILYLSILEKYQNYHEATYMLGVIAYQVGQYSLAIARFEQTLALKPNYVDAHNNLADALKAMGRLDEAIFHYKKTLSIKPDFPEPHINLGNCLSLLNRVDEAIDHFKQALSIKPDFVKAHFNLGNSLKERGKMEEAISHYEKALALRPDLIAAHNNIGALLQDMGRKEEAIKHYEQALIIKPDFAWMHFNLTKIKPKQEQIPIIENLLASPTISIEDAMYYHHALGNIYNEAKSYSNSFEHYLKGNKLKRKTIDYDAQKHTEFVDRLIETYSEDYFQNKIVCGSDSELPVFILGMPRSGTTLVEQIVSCHPNVFGADELTTLANIEIAIIKHFETSMPYPECISLFEETNAQIYSAEYLQELRVFSRDATRITDKAPYNFLRIGLIKILFPKARIIHCKRNALDTCTSIFLNYFASGNEFSYDLTEIGQYYLDYKRLMEHWHNLFPNEIFDVQYEELISNQNEISQQLINYLGLEWDDACLDFHKNKRAVKTASNLQVRQPIYTKSVERWKRYENYLQPLINILQDS